MANLTQLELPDGTTYNFQDTISGYVATDATTSAHGLMSASDKTKLNGIASGAEVNQNAFSNVTVGTTTVAADSKTDTLTLVGGANITLTPDATNDKITISLDDTVDTGEVIATDIQAGNLIVNGTSRFLNTINGTASNSEKLNGQSLTSTYSSTGTAPITGAAVASAIGTLDGTVSGSPSASKTLTAFSQTDGKVSATFGNISITKSQVSDFPTLGTAAAKNYTTSVSSGSADLVTSGAVWTAIDNLPEPMVFKGSLGTGGTITTLPVDGTAKVGDTYKVITAGTYASKAAKVGDTFICLTKTSSANTWELIPSGDEPSGTVTSVGISNGGGLSVSGSPITSSGTITISHADTSSQASVNNSGRTYIQDITLDTYGHVTGITSATETVVNTDRYVNSAAFADATSADANNPVKMTLTRAGSDTASVTAYIPKVSSSSAGVVPKGAAVSSQSQTTKFLREDGTWAAPSYTTNTNTTYSLSASGESVVLSGSDNSSSTADLSGVFAKYTPFKGNLTSAIGSGSAAASTKTYWENNTNIPVLSVSTAYNTNGVEYSLLFSKGGTASYGSILRWGYNTRYIEMLRRSGGTWRDDDWVKIDAGYADKAGADGDGNTITTTYLPKTTYEWNKEVSFGSSGYLKIGSFAMYDSNVTVEINSTASTTYHGTLVIATQNVTDSSIGSVHVVKVYDDPTGIIASSLRIVWTSGSRNYDVYFVPSNWSKNLIHIQALGLYGYSDICTAQTGTAPTTTSGLEPINVLESKSAASGGTDVSMVTTGEKATWNAKASSDTKNTAGSTDTSSKIFLIGATTQAANPQTYSHDTAYVGTDGCLYSGGVKVLTAHQDISGKVSKSGDTMSGTLSSSVSTSTHINGAKGTNVIINSTAAANGYNMFIKANTTNGAFNFGYYTGALHLYYISQTKIDAGTNSFDKHTILMNESGDMSVGGALSTSSNISASGNISATGAITASGYIVGTTYGVSGISGTSGGISLYNGASYTANYGIAFRKTGTGTGEMGKHGYVQGDWATYFTMDGTASNRGWVFRHASNGNVASITADGNQVLNGSLTLGGNTTNTSGVRQVYNSTTKSLDFVFVA